MSADDPRWRIVLDFCDWVKKGNAKRNPEEFLRKWKEYTGILENIAYDPHCSLEEQDTAKRRLDELAVQARAHSDNMIRAVVELANDEARNAPNSQGDAQRLLVDITDRLPTASHKLN